MSLAAQKVFDNDYLKDYFKELEKTSKKALQKKN